MEYYFYNLYHYGDNILNLKFLRNLPLKKNRITIHYYYNPYYIKNTIELEEYITPEIILHNSNLPSGAIDLWMGKNPILEGYHYEIFDEYYKRFYKCIVSHMGLSNINISLYHEDPQLLTRYETLSEKYKDIDILILNTPPLSGQYEYNNDEWNELSLFLHSKFKVVTAQHVSDDIPCTMRDSFTIHNIAAISTHAKYIVAVHSGPLMACYNAHTKASVQKWFIFHDKNHHTDLNAVDCCTMYNVSMFFILLDSTRSPS